MSPFFRRKRKIQRSTKPKAVRHVLPPKAFTFATTLYPIFIWALEQANIDGPRLFVLSFLRRSRETNTDGRPIRLHTEITRTYRKLMGVDIKRADELLASLHDEGLVRQELPIGDPRPGLTDSPAGMHRRTVVLTRDGEDTLDRFNGFINQFADELISNIPRIKARTIELLIGRFASIADTLTVAAERMAEEMHLVGDPNDAADSKA